MPGLEHGIRLVGEQLRQFFPYDAATDVNELPDDISYGDDAPTPTPPMSPALRLRAIPPAGWLRPRPSGAAVGPAT